MSASYSGDASPARFHIEGMQHQDLQQLPAATDGRQQGQGFVEHCLPGLAYGTLCHTRHEDSQQTSLQAILEPAPLAPDDAAAVSSVVQRMIEAVSFRWVTLQCI